MSDSFAMKWQYDDEEYYTYVLPVGASMYSKDFEEIVSCAECGERVKFGNCYTSLQVHDLHGFGFAVCSKCYDEEMKEYRRHQNKVKAQIRAKEKGDRDSDRQK